MTSRLPRQKRAQLFPLIMIIAVIAVMGGGAFLLSRGLGSELTGFSTYEGGCNGTIDSSGTYNLGSGLTCPSTDNGINISADDVTLDCNGATIEGSSSNGYGIKINGTNNVVIKNCRISGFGTGIVYDDTGDIISGELRNNVITAGAHPSFGTDVNFGDATGITVLQNHFRGGGLTGTDLSDQVFCNPPDDDIGNFYRVGIGEGSRGPGDCGYMNLSNSTGGTSYGGYNRTNVSLAWKPQSSAEISSVSYNLSLEQYYDDVSAWYVVPGAEEGIWTGDTGMDILYAVVSEEDVLPEVKWRITVQPVDSSGVRASSNMTDSFILDFDADGDGYGLLSDYSAYDAWDCNDTNLSIHQPAYRENDTNPEFDDFCYNAVDDDCDDGLLQGGIDWLDDGCGHGFTVGDFDDTLYTGGYIDDITTSHVKDGAPDDYLVVVENEYGRIEYGSATDLTGVDFNNVFDFSYNELSVDPSQYDGRFNKPATVSFKDLASYHKVPVVLKDGSVCGPDDCTNMLPDPDNPAHGDFSEFGHNILFDVDSFSTFTTTANSRLSTFTQNDSEAAGASSTFPTALETYHRISFFANYTRFSDGMPINNETPTNPGGDDDVHHNGTCNITLMWPNGTAITGSDDARMEFDPYYGVYRFESGVFNFTFPSSYYRYDISCWSNLYEPINATGTFKVAEDETPPEPPVLYPQILLYPDNMTDNKTTWVAGYFGESDINLTATVLHSHWPKLELRAETNYSGVHSEYKGEIILVKEDANRGQNVVLVEWSTTNQHIEDALDYFKYVEFSSHNRTYFDRYKVKNFTRGGNYIWIELEEDLDEPVAVDDFMRFYSAPHPPGYFRVNVSLYTGSNLISVWGEDHAGNEGYASEDTINAPYPDTAPPAPVLWGPPEAVKNNSAFDLVGFINESSERLNVTVVLSRGDFLNFTSDDEFRETTLHTAANVYSEREAGRDFFYIDQSRFEEIELTLNWEDLWVEFSNHDRDFWFRYDVTDGIDYPVENGSRVYIDPALEQGIDETVIVSFYNNTYHQGWFNTSVNITNITLADSTSGGLYKLRAVGFRNETEGYPSASYDVYNDPEAPEFLLDGVPTHSNERNPVFRFNVTDDFRVDISTLLLNVSNETAGYYRAYAYSPEAFPSHNITGNITCHDYYGNQSLYNCSVVLDDVGSMNYTVNFTVLDKAGWRASEAQQMEIVITIIDVSYVYDDDDITNDLWLNFTWGPSPPNLQEYEFALGTAAYPDDDFDSVKGWQSSCDTLGSCFQNRVNFSHDRNASDINETELNMTTGTVYYLTVRAKNDIGQYGTPRSSDGILFIDPTPPVFKSIDDHGPWTDSGSELSANWLFEDNESQIIEYAYAIGTARYPDTGWNDVKGPVYGLGSASSSDTSLSLSENGTYYYSVKARNGNSAMNYTGSWSGWASSGGVTVDTLPPYGGSISWTNSTYITSGFVTVQYDVGEDLPGTSDNVQGMIQLGSSVLSGGICEPVSDFDWQNSSDTLPAGQSFRDVNVSSGRCYVFRLFTWDMASNSRTYQMPNETVRVVKVDQTPPTDVAPVLDDGFYTNDRTSLHAGWSVSSDGQSGLSHYSWNVREQSVASPACTIDIADPENTDCDIIVSGNTTADEISINGLDLTHNHKYFFEVRAWNNAGRNSTPRYSDGIIYLDNTPPATVQVEQVNEVNETSSPYYTKLRTNMINITAIGDFDGYNDISNCVVLPNNVDYREDHYGENCTEYPHHYFSEEYPDVTLINCSMNVSPDMGSAVQGNYSWYISCRDHYWNAQSFNDNGLVEFTLDWPEAPWISVEITNNTDGTIAYSDTSLWCEAELTDPDEEKNLNCSNIEFSWYRGQTLIRQVNESAYDSGTGWCSALNVLSSGDTARSQDITCSVKGYDTYYPVYNTANRSNDSVFIRNTMPSDVTLDLPADDDVLSSNITFGWMGPYDDVDSDFLTLEIQVDDDSGSFNCSDNPPLGFNPPQEMKVGGISIPGTQRNADIYRSRVVYEDNRSSHWDVYMYDFDTDTETPIATSAGDQFNPRIYGDYILYEHDIGGGNSRLYRYSISSAVTDQVDGSIVSRSMDFFGSYAAYNNGSGVVYKDVVSGGPVVLAVRNSTAEEVSVYGTDLLWTNADRTAYLYDIVNSSYVSDNLPVYDYFALFGLRTVAQNSTGDIRVLNALNGSEQYVVRGDNASIYGGLLAYRNASGGITVTDLLGDRKFNVSLGAGTAPDLYDDLLVFEKGDDLYFASRKDVIPACFIIENPIDANYYTVDTAYSGDGDYDWRLVGCDSAFSFNDTSCVTSETRTVTVDNTAPEISSISPTQSSVVGGIFRVWARITDTPGDYTDVESANYTIKYRSNSNVFSAGSMSRSGNVWNSSFIDFTMIDLADFSLFVSAADEMGNWAHDHVNFTINNDTPWFIFGTGADEITLDGMKAFNSTIPSDFIAYNVLTSKLTIRGPLPSETVRFVQSKVNTTVTNHYYTDDIYTATWPEGEYEVYFNGSTLGDLDKYSRRTFWIDKAAPVYYDASPASVMADEAVTLSINWTDATLADVNMTYYNPDIDNATAISEDFEPIASSQVFSSQELDLCEYINQAFYWRSEAVDMQDITTSTGWMSLQVLDNAPYFQGVIADKSVDEDSSADWEFSLSDHFGDLDAEGACADLDNLTFSYTTNVSAIELAMDPLSGQVWNLTANQSDFNGDVNLTFVATDYYGNSTWSDPVTITVNSVNDAPYFNAAIPDMDSLEDNETGLVFNLSSYADDVDGDPINWSVLWYDDSIVNLTYSNCSGDFTFGLLPDANGVFNITFGISDGIISSPVTAEVQVNVINVGDAPTRPAITNSTTVPAGQTPDIGSANNAAVPVTWNASTDADGEAVTYTIEYSADNGTSWNIISSGWPSASYSWDSASNITGEKNVTLRVTASAGAQTNESGWYGNFTVDNLGPGTVIDRPANIVVGTSAFVNVSTGESADCSLLINGTLLNQTSAMTEHHALASGLSYNTTYEISAACEDYLGNLNSTSKLFAVRQTGLMFVGADANRSVLIEGESVNVTFEIWSRSPLTAFNWTLTNGTQVWAYNISDIAPAIDQYNSLAYVTAPIDTVEEGAYALAITNISSSMDGDKTSSEGGLKGTIFTVFPSFTQTINVE